MRILLVSDSYPPNFGGMARSASRLRSNLLDFGAELLGDELEVDVISIGDHDNDDFLLWISDDGKERDMLHRLKMVVEEYILTYNPDILIGFYVNYSAYVTTLLGRKYDIPVIISARGNDIERGLFNPSRIPMIQASLGNCTVLTSVSTYLIELAQSLVPDIETRVVYNGIKIPDDYVKVIDEKLTIGFFGDSRNKKGLDILIAALHTLSGILDRKIRCIIGGKLDRNTRDDIESLHLDNIRIKLIKELPADHIDEFYSRINLMVIPSRYDGFPNVLLEAISRKIPVIISDHPSMTEYFSDQQVIYFRTGKYLSLANVLHRYITNKIQINVDDAYNHLKNNYTIELEINRWCDAIRYAINLSLP